MITGGEPHKNTSIGLEMWKLIFAFLTGVIKEI